MASVPVPARRGKNLSVRVQARLGWAPSSLRAWWRTPAAHTSKEGALTRADVERFLRVDLLPQLLPGHARVPGSVLVRVQARLRWTTPAFTRAAISSAWPRVRVVGCCICPRILRTGHLR